MCPLVLSFGKYIDFFGCSAKGNIVVELSGQNAARTLLKAVQDLPSSLKGVADAARLGTDRSAEKDKEYFAAIFNAEDRDVRHIVAFCRLGAL